MAFLSRSRDALARRPLAAIVAIATILTAAPRLWAALSDDSVFYPDEIFQTLEQGHRFAFGYGFIPWEFREAARSWSFPGMLGIVLRAGALLGLSTGPALAHFAKCFMVLVVMIGAWAALRLAHERAGIGAAILAGTFYALLPPFIVLGARCTTELASAALVPWGALLAYGAKRSARRAAIAGALVGATVFFRYQNGLLFLSCLAMLIVARRWRDTLAFAIGGAVLALFAGGLLDWITWGKPFQSALVYLRFNLIEGHASHWGTSPPIFYAKAMWTSCGPLVVLLAIGLLLAAPGDPAIVAIALVYFAAHSIVPHKQLRFLLTVFPLFAVAAGIGLARALDRARPRAGRAAPELFAVALAAVIGVAFAARAAAMTYPEMGDESRGNRSAWHADEGATILLGKAGARPDVCGVMLVGIDRGYTGAFSYFHRDLPFFNDAAPDAQPSANYLVGPRGGRAPPGYEWLESADTFALYRRDGPCAPAPRRYTLETGEDPLAELRR